MVNDKTNQFRHENWDSIYESIKFYINKLIDAGFTPDQIDAKVNEYLDKIRGDKNANKNNG